MKKYNYAALISLLGLITALATCSGCSLSPEVQTSEVRPLVERVVEYHDERVPGFLDASEVSDALGESAALLSALGEASISQGELRVVLAPVLQRYQAILAAEDDALEKRVRLRDVVILRDLAGM